MDRNFRNNVLDPDRNVIEYHYDQYKKYATNLDLLLARGVRLDFFFGVYTGKRILNTNNKSAKANRSVGIAGIFQPETVADGYLMEKIRRTLAIVHNRTTAKEINSPPRTDDRDYAPTFLSG